MKVLMIIDKLTFGGRERRFVELLKWFHLNPCVTCEVVILSQNVHFKEIFDLKFKLHLLSRKSKKDLSIFFQLYKICKSFRPDIIHSWESMPSIYAVPSAVLLNIKLINGMIAFAPSKIKPFSKLWIRSLLTFPFSSKIVSNSVAGLQSFKVPENKAICIHNGFDDIRITNLTDNEEIKTRFGIRSNFVVGMVGAFSPRKDYVTFLKAAMQVLSKNLPITFVSVGAGEDLNAAKSLVAKQYQKSIIFCGLQTDVESIVNVFDIGVLTTNHKIHGEGISNSILEYMALRKPVIATKGGGTGEIVINGETGFTIEPQNPDKLAEKIIFLYDNKPIALEMGNKGRLRVENEFSMDKMAKSYLELYDNVLFKADKLPESELANV